jgi:hypothetical protein
MTAANGFSTARYLPIHPTGQLRVFHFQDMYAQASIRAPSRVLPLRRSG